MTDGPALTVGLDRLQRDALLEAVSVSMAEADDAAAEGRQHGRYVGVMAGIADDLTLPDATGAWKITSPTRDQLVDFLEHELMLALEGFDLPQLPLWHACVTLLAALGHEPAGSIYERVTCGCARCGTKRWRLAGVEARLRRATTDVGRRAVLDELRAMA